MDGLSCSHIHFDLIDFSDFSQLPLDCELALEDLMTILIDDIPLGTTWLDPCSFFWDDFGS